MGARVWWKWISSPHTPWAILWIAKYANNQPVDDLIRLTEVGLGSLISNAAKQNKGIIQQHSFWDVRDGNNARFWEDSWQQRPKRRDLIKPHQIPDWEEQLMNKVSQR